MLCCFLTSWWWEKRLKAAPVRCVSAWRRRGAAVMLLYVVKKGKWEDGGMDRELSRFYGVAKASFLRRVPGERSKGMSSEKGNDSP